MSYIKLFIVSILLILPICNSASAKNGEPKSNIKMKKAHDFFTYLTTLGVVEITSKAPCKNGEISPELITYLKERCISIFRTSYTCLNDSEKVYADTKIDWRYISEMKQSGYDNSGKEITIAGHITIANADNTNTQIGNAELTKATTISFDSSQTTQRALNAFTLLSKKCDTSKDFPF